MFSTAEQHFVSDPGVQRVGTLHLDLTNTLPVDSFGDSADHCCRRKCCCCSARCKVSDSDDVFVGDSSDKSLGDGDDATLCGSDCQGSSRDLSCCSKSECEEANALRREISVHLKFGDTEVKASAVDHKTGKCVKANFDFLSL